MPDPFAAALAVLHNSVCSVAATYTPEGGSPAVPIRVIRHQGTKEARLDGDTVLIDCNEVQIQRSDIAMPIAGSTLDIGDESFLLQGGPQLDASGLTWTCPIEPA